MKEQVARDVVLVRAIEAADHERKILSEDDLMYAGRSAKELAQWQAADTKSGINPEDFLQHRSEQLLKKIVQRYPGFSLVANPRSAMSVLSMLLAVLAFGVGFGVDRLGNPHRIDLLHWPLLVILGWNFLIYLWMIVALFPPLARSKWADAGWLQGWSMRKNNLLRKLPSTLHQAVAAFSVEWLKLSNRLTVARIRRTMHLCSALFAGGVIVSFYVRGFLSQYAIGWESTFFDAKDVHSILSVLFFPAVRAFPIQGFTVADIEALRFTGKPLLTEGARWVHLYSGTLLLLVVVPRMIFAAVAHWQVNRLADNFPVDLQQPYFHKFNQLIGGRTTVLRVLPYSFTVDERRDQGLSSIAVSLFGRDTRLMLRPSIPYGEDLTEVLRDTGIGSETDTVTVVLFSLAATPEKEAHGSLIKHLLKASSRGIAVLIDESGFIERFGAQADGKALLARRILHWQQFCNEYQVSVNTVNLLDPDLEGLISSGGLKLSGTP